MSEKKQSLFREKSLDTIESPEALNDYLKVTSPGVWLFLCAVALILCGFIVWGIYGRINTTVKVAAVSGVNVSYCIVPYESAEQIATVNSVTVNGEEHKLTGEIVDADVISEETSAEIRIAGGFEIGDVYAVLMFEDDFEDGVEQGTAVTESLQPISLLLQ